MRDYTKLPSYREVQAAKEAAKARERAITEFHENIFANPDGSVTDKHGNRFTTDSERTLGNVDNASVNKPVPTKPAKRLPTVGDIVRLESWRSDKWYEVFEDDGTWIRLRLPGSSETVGHQYAKDRSATGLHSWVFWEDQDGPLKVGEKVMRAGWDSGYEILAVVNAKNEHYDVRNLKHNTKHRNVWMPRVLLGSSKLKLIG